MTILPNSHATSSSENESTQGTSTEEREKEHNIDPPDGGTTAWLVILGAWCTSFCSFGWLNSIGIFQNYYESNLLKGTSSSTIAWIPSLQIFFMSALGPAIGYWFDRRGPHEVMLFGTFMHVFGLMMASISKKYYQLLLSQGVCSAIGAAAIFQPALGCVPGWFNKRRAAAFGVLMTGSSLGGVLFPIMVTHLINEVGYGWSMRIAAFIILFLLIIANLTVKRRVKLKQPKLTTADFHRPLREPAFMLVLGGFLLLTFGMCIPINFLVIEAATKGMAEQLAEYLVSIFNAASLFGRVSSGVLGDKIGRYNVFVLVCTISGVLVLGLWIPGPNNAARIAFAAFFGFFSGAYISLSPALIAQISPPKEFGYRSGLLFFAGAIPGLVTSPIAGAILARNHGSYTTMKVYSGVFILAGSAVVAIARLLKTGLNPIAKF